jgi:hypothetical protein
MTATSTQEEIRIGPLAIRFLLEGEASGGSAAVFEFDVPAKANVPVAHRHDAYEETLYGLEGVLTWTIDGEKRQVGPGEVLSTSSRTKATSTRSSWRSSVPASSAPTTSATSPPWSTLAPAAHPTRPRLEQSCAATASPPHETLRSLTPILAPRQGKRSTSRDTSVRPCENRARMGTGGDER